MNFKEKFMKVLTLLGFEKKIEGPDSLTAEEFAQVVERYQKEYQTTVEEDLAAFNAARAEEKHQQQLGAILEAISKAKKKNGCQSDDESDDDDNDKGDKKPGCQSATIDQVLTAVQGLTQQMQQLAQEPADDRPAHTADNVAPLSINGFGNTKEYLFGVQHEMFDMTKRWNQIAANPGMYAAMAAPDEESEGRAFRKAARQYAQSLASRYAYLQQGKLLQVEPLASGEYSTNFDASKTAGLGDQFVIRRQDALIARVLKKRLLTQFFPVRYGIQDRDLLYNAFFGEVSQAYQQGEIYKGDMTIEPEMGYVDDAMVKLKFGPMKELERMYIGYLNREGSDPIKWSMIEYCLLNQLEQMQVEQNKRRMRGIYVKPETGIAGSYLNASTGILYTLLRYVHDYSIKPHDDEEHSYRRYTESTMLDAVQAFVADVSSTLSEDEELGGRVLYLNEKHRPWWIQNIRAKYGKDFDFTGPQSYVNTVPDYGVQIVWLPYLGSIPFMLIAEPGNIQFIENIPGEMFNVKMEEQMEMVRAWAVWKEGCGAAFTGRKFSTREAMDANNYEFQQIYMNIWAKALAADATTADGASIWQTTAANTKSTVITDITGAKTGVAYCIECGSTVNASTVAKSGKFANISSAYTPTKVGDYLMVILRSDNTFAELERCVGGVRTINVALQPNVPGGRK